MPTNAEMTARLLGDAAGFFRNMGKSNADIKKQMDENAAIFDRMAEVMRTQPEGRQGELAYSKVAGDMLKNAAKFYLSVGQQNEPIREQLERSAEIYHQLAQLVAEDPLGWMD
jgi:hypothetical protein